MNLYFDDAGGNQMEELTLGNIGADIAFIVALIGGIIYLKNQIQHWIETALNPKFNEVNSRLDKIDGTVDDRLRDADLNFLVASITDFENGHIDESQRVQFWKVYDRYTDNGSSSYIENRVSELKREGKLERTQPATC